MLAAVIVAGALFAFGVYIRTLSNELSRNAGAAADRSLTHTPLPDARAGGAFAASLLLGSGQRDRLSRCEHARHRLSQLHRADPRPTVTVRARGDLSGDPAPGPARAVILGLATAFGLQSLLRARRQSLHHRQEQRRDAGFDGTVFCSSAR